MLIKTAEVISIDKGYGPENYYPDDIIEVRYRKEKEAVLPQCAVGRFDSIRHRASTWESILYLDASDKYRNNMIQIPVDGIEDIRRIKQERSEK